MPVAVSVGAAAAVAASPSTAPASLPSSTPNAPPSADARGAQLRLWWREASGSVGDLGVLIPIAVALIVSNGLSPTAVFLPAGLLYLGVAAYYRVPVAVQPLKAFGAVAIAAGLGADVIAAGALIMGATFLLLGIRDWLDRIAALFPVAVVRGIQLSVGLLFAKIAWSLVSGPQPSFTHQATSPALLVIAVIVFVVLLLLRRHVVLIVVLAAVAVAAAASGGLIVGGPSPLVLPQLTWESFELAAVMLVLPQLPLTFANSCLAPASAARQYFGSAGQRVTPARLARTLGAANVFVGAISGMPVCHGAGGMSAHYAFGARTWRAPFVIGTALVVTALAAGASLVAILPAFPLSVLAALLAVAAVAHLLLLRDLRGFGPWVVAITVGVLGLVWNLAIALVIGLALAGLFAALARLAAHRRQL